MSDEGVPWARTGWNEIIPGLYQGGHWRASDGDVHEVAAGYEFGLVVSLYTRWGDHGPAQGVPHLRCLIPDGELHDAQVAKVQAMVPKVVDALRSGTKVLIRCAAGYNRSGLLTGLVLRQMGYPADDAITLIRDRRSPHALCNLLFVRLIHQFEPSGDLPCATP